MIDAATGAKQSDAPCFGAWLDANTLVESNGYQLRVVTLGGDDEVARAEFRGYVTAIAAPSGEVITAMTSGSEPGPVEVFTLYGRGDARAQ